MLASITNHGMLLDTIKTRVHSLFFQIVVVCAVNLFFNPLLPIRSPERCSLSISLYRKFNALLWIHFWINLNKNRWSSRGSTQMQQCDYTIRNKRNIKWNEIASEATMRQLASKLKFSSDCAAKKHRKKNRINYKCFHHKNVYLFLVPTKAAVFGTFALKKPNANVLW